jgi:predicted site-specific integrase-resolvase
MNEDNRRFLSIGQASEFTGLEAQTLRKLAGLEKIRCYRTPSGQRRFDRSSLEELCDTSAADQEESKSARRNILYARVSSRKQMGDLSRQLEYLRAHKPEYSTHDVISDVASGINFKRKGLLAILDACMQGTIGEVVVAHRDRLSRFGFDLIKLVVERAGGKITVLDDDKNKSSEQELSEDLLSIIHIFSCRQMGKRSYKKRGGNDSNSDQDIPEREPKEDPLAVDQH